MARIQSVRAAITARPARARLRAFRWAGVLLTAVALVWIAHGLLLRGIGAVLVVEDPLRPAVGLVVLGGHLPFRAMEAAELYRAGWAPRVVVTPGARREEHRALRAIGVPAPEEWELTREVLRRLGVPLAAILVPDGEADGTLEELGIAARALEPGGRPVILVTSKVHARRVRLTWEHVTGGRSRGIVRPAREDPFDASRWWRERRFALAVVREYLGLLNYWVGFPVAARAAGLSRGDRTD